MKMVYLIFFLKIRNDFAKIVFCCSCDRRFLDLECSSDIDYTTQNFIMVTTSIPWQWAKLGRPALNGVSLAD